VLSSPGRPLDATARAFFEPRFGYDFSQVRVHTSERASQSAGAIGARAYTAGTEIAFEAGQYSPETTEGRRLLAHELAHAVQQGAQAPGAALVQRDSKPPPKKDPKPPKKDESANLRNDLQTLADKKVNDYAAYRDATSKATKPQKQAALADQQLLLALEGVLDVVSFGRCVEGLGRHAPTFDELKKNKDVHEEIEKAWRESNPDGDRISPPHEEGGWIFLNLVDGSLHIERAGPDPRANEIVLNPAPAVDHSVVVAVFHTHPFLGGRSALPSKRDKSLDKRDGVPDLVAANTGKDPKKFQIYLSGPSVRPHLGSDTKFPGPSGGIAP
jgi:hypothetical protein